MAPSDQVKTVGRLRHVRRFLESLRDVLVLSNDGRAEHIVLPDKGR